MEHAILKKRLGTFRNPQGQFRKVSEEVLVDFLRAYESWPGIAKDFYREVGVSKMQFSVLMGKAKKICREGRHPEGSEFKELALDIASGVIPPGTPCSGIELSWSEGKVIRFAQVEQLVEFLKKAA